MLRRCFHGIRLVPGRSLYAQKRVPFRFSFFRSWCWGGFGPVGNVSTARVPYKKAKAKSAEGKLRSVDFAEGHPILWKEPARIESLNLLYGQGGREGAPNLSDKFTFVDKDRKGASLKIHVRDSEEREWTVKFGREARPETSASRIVWAMGYHTDNDYLVRRVHIDGWGDAQNVRFERRHYGFRDIGYWTWERNFSMERGSSTGSRCRHGIAQQLDLSTSIIR